jgi:hypothetical protein
VIEALNSFLQRMQKSIQQKLFVLLALLKPVVPLAKVPTQFSMALP